MLGPFWKAGEADWNAVERALAWAGALRGLAARAANGDPDRARDLVARWTEVVASFGEGGDGARRPLDGYVVAHDAYAASRAAIEGLLALDVAVAWGSPEASGHLARVRATASAWSGKPGELAHLVLVLARAGEGLRARDRAARRRPRRWPRADGGASRHVRAGVLRVVGGGDRRDGRAPAHVHRRRPLAKGDRVPGARPRAAPARERGRAREALGPRAATLRRSRRGLGALGPPARGREEDAPPPVRKLFARIPNLLPRLKPCLLMSPLSVAQYLERRAGSLRPRGLRRGVADPDLGRGGRDRPRPAGGRRRRLEAAAADELLPARWRPRRARTRTTIEELESVLDECRAARLPSLDLGWHYRSRHESLIAFSNQHYYEKRLLTFPSPDAARAGLGVERRHVPDGRLRPRRHRSTNRAEAEAVVADVVRRLSDPIERGRSIGIVTFNLPAAGARRGPAREARRAHPELERRSPTPSRSRSSSRTSRTSRATSAT